jgi:hypothetical protein
MHAVRCHLLAIHADSSGTHAFFHLEMTSLEVDALLNTVLRRQFSHFGARESCWVFLLFSNSIKQKENKAAELAEHTEPNLQSVFTWINFGLVRGRHVPGCILSRPKR